MSVEFWFALSWLIWFWFVLHSFLESKDQSNAILPWAEDISLTPQLSDLLVYCLSSGWLLGGNCPLEPQCCQRCWRGLGEASPWAWWMGSCMTSWRQPTLTPVWARRIIYMSSKKMVWPHFTVDMCDDSTKQMMKQTRIFLLKIWSVDQNTGMTWELFRNPESQAPLHTCRICRLMRPPGDLYVCESVRSTEGYFV